MLAAQKLDPMKREKVLLQAVKSPVTKTSQKDLAFEYNMYMLEHNYGVRNNLAVK